jgi:hypothetical protein
MWRKFLSKWGAPLNPPLEFSSQDQARYHEIFSQCQHVLDEKSLRLVAAAMVLSLGYGGQKAIPVPVRFGATSANAIQVLAGLIPGDRIIVSNTGDFAGKAMVRIQ